MNELVLRDFEAGTVIRLGLGLRLDFGFELGHGLGLRRGSGGTLSGIGAETVADIETFVPAERVWQFEVDEEALKRADREASKALRDALREAREGLDAPDARYAPDAGVAAHLRGASRSVPSGESFRSSHFSRAFRSVRTYPQVELRINGQVVRTAIAREEREERKANDENDANDANDTHTATERNATNDASAVSGVAAPRDVMRGSAPGGAVSASSSALSSASSPETPLPAKRFVWVLTPVDRLGAPVAAMAYELGTADVELGYRLGSGPWEEAQEALEVLEDLQELEGFESFNRLKKPAALADFGPSSAPEAVFRAEPVFLCVPERDSGYVVKLSNLVFERAGKWFVRLEKNETNGKDAKDGSDGKDPDAERDSHSQSSSGSTLKRRIAILERLLRTYEECAHYLRANARFRLVPQSRVDAVEKLRAVTSDTVRYVAEHPDELVPSPNGAGLRIGGRTYLPRHVLVESSAKRFDTYENRAILGVLAALGEELRADAREAAERAEKLRVREPDRPGYVSTASPLAKDAAKRILAYAEALFGLERRRSVLFRDYRTMLPAEPLLLTLTNGRDTLRPTEVFRSIPAYRALFEAISGVQRSEKPVLENEAALLTACGRSRVFELHALFRVLEGLSAAGFINAA